MLAAAAAIPLLLAASSATSAETIAQRHGVTIAADAAWTEDELADVDAVLSSLPPRLLAPPGGPLRFERAELRSAFGVDGPVEPLAERRLRQLSPSERVRLWRRRAVVHQVLRRWDASQRWSDRAEWRRISGWIRPFERPLAFREQALNIYEGAFSRREGMTSAALDLLTFAEEALVPAESLRPDVLSADESVRCQEFAKSRFLEHALAELGAPLKLTGGPCPAFDGWARLESLRGAEVLYVAASGRAPESLFGHLLLRLVHAEGERVQGPSFGTAVQLVALTGSDAPDVRYLWRGTTGGYATAVLTAPVGELVHQTVESEQRTIRRFRLQLSRAELVRLAERVWELERRGYFEYWFFTDNCATTLAFLLEGVLEEGRTVPMPPRLSPVLPSAVLDGLADAGLLVPEPGAFESIRDRAARSESLRGEAATALEQGAISGEWRRIRVRVEDPRLAVRRTGWTRLHGFTRASAEAMAPRQRRALFEYWLHTVRIERYAVERADAARREVLAKAIDRAGVKFPGADQTVRDRQQLFAREDSLTRRLAVLDRIAFSEEALRRAPLDRLGDAERQTLREAEALTEGFAQLTALHGEAIDAAFSEIDPAETLEADTATRANDERRWATRALSRSGYARMAAGLGASARAGELSPAVVIESGALDERLGEQRLHGFRSSSELRVLAGRMELRPTRGLPEVARSELTLLGYRTLEREVATFRRSPLDSLGWGARATWDRDAQRTLADRAAVEAEALWVPSSTPTFARFTAVGLGLSTRWSWGARGPAREGLEAGPMLSFEQRVPLGDDLADALTLQTTWRPAWNLGSGKFRHEVDASLGGSIRLRSIFGREVLLSPRAHLVAGEHTRAGLDLLIEPLGASSAAPRR